MKNGSSKLIDEPFFEEKEKNAPLSIFHFSLFIFHLLSYAITSLCFFTGLGASFDACTTSGAISIDLAL